MANKFTLQLQQGILSLPTFVYIREKIPIHTIS